MELNALVDSMQVVELMARSRIDAIRELVSAGGWDASDVSADHVVAAIEDREATAQTVIAPGLAFPHAVIAAGRGFRLVLGRSRTGIQYGAAADRESPPPVQVDCEGSTLMCTITRVKSG